MSDFAELKDKGKSEVVAAARAAVLAKYGERFPLEDFSAVRAWRKRSSLRVCFQLPVRAESDLADQIHVTIRGAGVSVTPADASSLETLRPEHRAVAALFSVDDRLTVSDAGEAF